MAELQIDLNSPGFGQDKYGYIDEMHRQNFYAGFLMVLFSSITERREIRRCSTKVVAA
ncbi:MAG: hypothetical protein JKX91_10250 [Rhizobiaceae bacterium]|nr:hypothetical protein [Rhizobiaceae bacterium]